MGRDGGPVGHCCETQRSWRVDSIVQATSWSSVATVAPAVTSAFQVGDRQKGGKSSNRRYTGVCPLFRESSPKSYLAASAYDSQTQLQGSPGSESRQVRRLPAPVGVLLAG